MRGGVICGQTTETYTFSNFTSSTSVSLKGQYCTIQLKKESGSTNPAWNSDLAKVYAKGSVTVSSTDRKISKIVYNYTPVPNKNNKVPTISSVTPEGFDEKTKTWTSTEGSNSVKMTLGGTAGSFGFTSLEITYLDTTDPSKTTTSLSFGEEYDGKTITKYIGDDNIYSIPATLTPSIEGASITYKSSNSELVYVDDKGDMMICGTEPGSATITAEYAGDDTYASSSVSYTVQVKKPVVVEDGVFDFTSGELDYGSGLTAKTGSAYGNDYDKNTKWVNGVIELSTTGGTRWIQDNDLYVFRVYSSQSATLTISVPNSYIIKKIDFGKCNSGLTPSTGIFSDGIWTGNSNSITFKATAKKDIDIITVTYYKALTTAASSFATYAADDAIDYSTVGLAAYAIELNEVEGKVAYNEISGTVEAGTPVLVKGEASTSYAMIPSTETATTVTTALQISDGSVTAADNLYYGFATLNGVSGFKLVQHGVTIPAKKGYLKLSSADNAKTFYAFDGNTTGIEETFSKNEAEKALAPMYNISGQRVGEGYKGIVIVNGKKYVK